MTLDRVSLRAALAFALMVAVQSLAWAGGTGFGDDEDTSADDGPSYFGFVREVNGPGVADAKVTAELKDRGALVTPPTFWECTKSPASVRTSIQTT